VITKPDSLALVNSLIAGRSGEIFFVSEKRIQMKNEFAIHFRRVFAARMVSFATAAAVSESAERIRTGRSFAY
jgi:hypothetical protein